MSEGKEPTTLTKHERLTLEHLAQRNMRYGTNYETNARLRELGLVESHATGKSPPGAWVWRITNAGRKVLEE